MEINGAPRYTAVGQAGITCNYRHRGGGEGQKGEMGGGGGGEKEGVRVCIGGEGGRKSPHSTPSTRCSLSHIPELTAPTVN